MCSALYTFFHLTYKTLIQDRYKRWLNGYGNKISIESYGYSEAWKIRLMMNTLAQLLRRHIERYKYVTARNVRNLAFHSDSHSVVARPQT